MTSLRLDILLKPLLSPKLIPALISMIVILLSHFALSMIPYCLPFLSINSMLAVAALVMVSTHALTGLLRRFLGLRASATAMVFSHILFIWGFHYAVIRKGKRKVSSLLDASLNMECVLLLIGLYRISNADPGIVKIESACTGTLGQTDPLDDPSNKGFLLFSRVRCCNICKRYVKGFDHHCPAFGNCIGQKNHHLFMVLVIGFIVTEVTFTMCSSQYIQATSGANGEMLKSNFPGNFVISTLHFSFLQVLWQVPFLTWHMYCICYNIKTEEWVNWNKYPEFQLAIHSQQATRFVNPYNQGILSNFREYCTVHTKDLAV